MPPADRCPKDTLRPAGHRERLASAARILRSHRLELGPSLASRHASETRRTRGGANPADKLDKSKCAFAWSVTTSDRRFHTRGDLHNLALVEMPVWRHVPQAVDMRSCQSDIQRESMRIVSIGFSSRICHNLVTSVRCGSPTVFSMTRKYRGHCRERVEAHFVAKPDRALGSSSNRRARNFRHFVFVSSIERFQRALRETADSRQSDGDARRSGYTIAFCRLALLCGNPPVDWLISRQRYRAPDPRHLLHGGRTLFRRQLCSVSDAECAMTFAETHVEGIDAHGQLAERDRQIAS